MDNKQTGNLLLGPENGDDVADDRTEGEATYEDNHGLQVHDASSATVVREMRSERVWEMFCPGVSSVISTGV